MKRNHIYMIMLAAAAMLGSCSKDAGWRVSGTVSNAPDGAKVAVEGFNAGIWYNIDSVEVAKDGSFAYQSPQGSPYPDIYRISLDGRSIYFPIDSLEAITVTTDADSFDSGYSVTGWSVAEEMRRLDQLIAQTVASKGASAALNDSVLKRELAVAVNDDSNGLLGYYIINKTIGSTPIFSAADRSDLRIIGSLANKFNTLYPGDPRTQYLTQLYLRGRAALGEKMPGTVIEAKEAGMFEIELYDADGTKQKLSDLVNKSGLTLLSFTSYLMDNSVPYNVELNRVYELFKPQGLGIYQVSVDPDEVEWRRSASSLPWTAVWYDQQDGGQLVRIYNVALLPTTYIIDRNGDIVDRVDNPADLEKTVRRHI